MSSPTPLLAALTILLTTFAHAAPVAITVTDSSSRPVSGAQVQRLIDTDLPHSRSNLNMALADVGQTDSSGQIRLDCDPALRTAFLVSAAHCKPVAFGFWGCVPPTYRLTLPPAKQTLSGRILDATGHPLPSALVRIQLSNFNLMEPIHIFKYFMDFTFPLTTRTDPAGRFSIPAPDGNVIEVAVRQSGQWRIIDTEATADSTPLDDAVRNGAFIGHLNATPVIPAAGASTTRPTAEPTLTIHLRVLDSQTNQPIPHVRVMPGGSLSPDQPYRTISDAVLDLTGDDVHWSFYDDAWAYFLRVEADGYASSPTRLVKASEKNAALELKLTKTAPVSIQILTPSGLAAAGAKAYLATPTIMLDVPPGKSAWYDPHPLAIADADGIIHFTPPADRYRLAISHPDGLAEVSPRFASTKTIHLAPWATATLTIGPSGDPASHTWLETQSWGISDDRRPPEDRGFMSTWIAFYTPGPDGRVTIPFCTPGEFEIYAANPPSTGHRPNWDSLELVPTLALGQHLDLPLLTGKTRLLAQLPELPGYHWAQLEIQPDGLAADFPPDINRLPRKLAADAARKAQESAPDPSASEKFINEITFHAQPDNTLSLAGLRPGAYRLLGFAQPLPGTESTAAATPPQLDWLFSVPTSQPPTLDLGPLLTTLPNGPTLNLGQSLPDLTSTTLDAQPFSLKSLHGHWVLLDFWGTWCGFCIAEEPTLKDAYEGWAADGRLIMVSASVDDTPDQVRQHVTTNHLAWTQLVLGPRDKTSIPQSFDVDGYPTIMLISPDGKLIETNLRGGRLRDTLMQHIGPPAPPPK